MVVIEKIEIDIIILSYAYTEELKQTTMDCINSLIASEDPGHIKFNVVVLESKKELAAYQYPHSKTIYPEQLFGYHRYMNMGIQLTSSSYLCLCNNDLIFHQHWASEILKEMEKTPDLLSASPVCSIVHPTLGVVLNSGVRLGYRVGFEIAGWCLFMKREIFRKIGKLDENYRFSGADHDYANTLGFLNIKHALITSSIVDHANSKTLKTQTQQRQDELTLNVFYHAKKWTYRILPARDTNHQL